jgi:hypothetical protein
MLRLYKYLFYKLYRFQAAVLDPTPAFTALVLLVVIQCFNVYFLVGIANWYLRRSIVPHFSLIEILLAMIILGLPQYFLLLHRRKLKLIVKEFENETSFRAVVGAIIVSLYALCSLAFAIWSVTLGPRELP